MKWALIIHEMPEMAQMLAHLVAEKVHVQAVAVSNLDAARHQSACRGLNDCVLLVTSLSPPIDALSPPPVDRSIPVADAFLKEMRERHADLPAIFLVTTDDGSRCAVVVAAGNTALLRVSEAYVQLPPLAMRLISGVAVPKPVHEIDLDIQLIGSVCRWSLRGTGNNPVEASGMILITKDELDRLLLDSHLAQLVANPTVDAVPGQQLIDRLGNDIYLHFIANNIKNEGLAEAFYGRLRDKTLLAAARIRFHVDQRTSPLLVETLAQPRSGNVAAAPDLWMLHTPIFRKFGGMGERHPLFKDRDSRQSPIHCLVIQGTAAPFSAGPPLVRGFPAIPMAEQEARWVYDYFNDNQQRFNLAQPMLMLPQQFADADYGAAVRAALAQQRWHLIHYTGHSALGANGRACLALGPGGNELLDIEEFSELARQSQFVFLNSCGSADARFIMRLIERNIPAVAGYAWPVLDSVAYDFSRAFYENLFEGERPKRFLEYAFMRSKAHLYNINSASLAWTSVQLFMQTLDAQPDT